MAGGTIRLDAEIKDRRVRRLLDQIAARCANAKPAMSAIGEVVATSIRKNFTAGGRPEAWPASKRVEADGGQTLIDRGILKNSINVRAKTDQVSIGTADVRAATLHFGAEKGSFGIFPAAVRAHTRKLKSGKTVTVGAHTRKQPLPWGDIPARPFMVIQDQDWDEIVAELTDFLSRL